MICFSCCLNAVVSAEADPDLLGSWLLTVAGEEADPRCGAIRHTGVLQIERQITPRAYRGNLRFDRTSERCRGSETRSSSVTVRVRDDVVTLAYDEEGWEEDRLLYKGDSMEGSRGGGITTHWKRPASGVAGDAPTAEQLAQLDAFLGQIQPELTSALEDQYLQNLEKSLGKSGLSEAEAEQVAAQL